MSGKRLLDAALFFNATRKIARQHIKLRSDQFEVWNKTSTVAKAIKNQTDRVTLTAQAASVLARRLNEERPPWTENIVSSQKTDQTEPIPTNEAVNSSNTGQDQREGLSQDHHYKRSQENATQDPTADTELPVQQKKPARYPIPDGTIPPDGAPLDISEQAGKISADGERVEAPPTKEPLEQDQQDKQGARTAQPSVGTSAAGSATGGSEAIPSVEAVPDQESIPEDINTDVFHSPRVSKLLGKNENKKKGTQDAGSSKVSFQRDLQPEFQATSTAPLANEEPSRTQASVDRETENLVSAIASDVETQPEPIVEPSTPKPYQMHESRVPSSRMGRLWQYSGLATSMAFGAVGETFKRATGNTDSSGSLILSAGNMERLVNKLSRMRGAALKLGQMISFQDSKMLPAPIQEVLQRVQDNADYMPASQRDKVLTSNLGSSWRDLFSSFDETPIAAASIGQVHRATLSSTNSPVAVKIQYPGVATSISSDLNNLSILLTASRLLPKGLYLDKTIANARTELAWECDYTREATCQERFRTLLTSESDIFTVPAVIPSASGPQVLTAELMHGTAVTKPSLRLTQPQRDWIGTQILRLCLRELTSFNFMQTDPNWTNFLFNPTTRKIELLDFGAAREFPRAFVDAYVALLLAAADHNTDAIRALSLDLGYLVGGESRAMLDAHVKSILTLAEPFSATNSPDALYDFKDQTITDRVRALIPVMLRERLAPPPEETYSLHRKLSGAFLLLARLGSKVKCREMFVRATEEWKARRGARDTETV